MQHSWHPGVLLPLPAAEPLLIGPLEERETRYLDIGWGDAGYYPNPDPGLWTLLRAALWPTPGVIQIVPVDGDVEAFAPQGPIVSIPLPDSLRDDVIGFILSELYLEDGAPTTVAPSLYGEGYFFAALRRYHMFHNSNQWAARLLAIAGCDLSVWQSLTFGLLFKQLESCGRVIRDASD